MLRRPERGGASRAGWGHTGGVRTEGPEPGAVSEAEVGAGHPWSDGSHSTVPALQRITAAHPGLEDRMADDPALQAAVLAVVTASPWLARVCATDPLAIEMLADLSSPDMPAVADTAEPFARLRRLKALGILRNAARDLLGIDSVDDVGRSLSALAVHLMDEAMQSTSSPSDGMAIIGLGKLGAAELNYASDIDLMLVAPDTDQPIDPRPFLELARAAWRVDLDLRPEGRSGAIIRTLASYQAYWSRWAETWEFQALLKARPVAGDSRLGAAFSAGAREQVWGRPFGADELRQLRRMKSRAESEIQRRNLAEREIKRGRGGIRDIEFAVQLLQLVHGRTDPSLRPPATIDALGALAAGGYVAPEDADSLAAAYRFLRKVEHRLQLYEGEQVHTLPRSPDRRAHLALAMGYGHDGNRSAEQQFDEDLRCHRAAARSIHERLFFRPLLEAFTSAASASGAPGASAPAAALPEEAVVERLAAFGFADAARTAQAVSELTRGFSRISQLMHRMLPLLLDWLSTSPDPDQGLLGLRVLASGTQSRDRLVAVCRESPAGAMQLCQLLGTAPRFARELQRHPESLAGLASGAFPAARTPAELTQHAEGTLRWRSGEGSVELGLHLFTHSEKLRIAARDVLGLDDTRTAGRALSDLADVVVAAALRHVDPPLPFAVIAMGRLGGREMAYSSDVDLLFVWDGAGGGSAGSAGQADSVALALTRLLAGDSPATGAYRVDLNLRPEGRHGPTSRSLQAYAAYYERWAEPWERQALLRSRFVAGDPGIGEEFRRLVDRFVWDRPLTADDVREIRRSKARIEKERVPAGEDPKFHLKLGPGSMSDVEWTVQLLQLRHRIPATGVMDGLDRLLDARVLSPGDGAVLREAYEFCARTRNRLSLIRDAPGESLPVTGPVLSTLARSLGFTPSGLRNEYARVTRRSRRVMERLFYES